MSATITVQNCNVSSTATSKTMEVEPSNLPETTSPPPPPPLNNDGAESKENPVPRSPRISRTGGGHRSRRSNSDVPQAVFDHSFMSMLPPAPPNFVQHQQMRAPRPEGDLNQKLDQEQRYAQPSVRVSPGRRSRRSNSDIPQAFFDSHLNSFALPQMQNNYQQHTAPYGYALGPHPPPFHNQVLPSMYYGHSFSNQGSFPGSMYLGPQVGSSTDRNIIDNGSKISLSPFSQQKEVQQIQNNLQMQQQPNNVTTERRESDAHTNGKTYSGGIPQFSQQQQHHHIPQHMIPLSGIGNGPSPLPMTWQQHGQYYQSSSLSDVQAQSSSAHPSTLPPSVVPSSGNQLLSTKEKRSNNRRQRTGQHPHRRSNSSSAAVMHNEYGSFWNGSIPPTNGNSVMSTTLTAESGLHNVLPKDCIHGHQSSILHPTGNLSLGRSSVGLNSSSDIKTGSERLSKNPAKSDRFSPRNEFRKMFQELSPQQSQRKLMTTSSSIPTSVNNSLMSSASPRVTWSPAVGPKQSSIATISVQSPKIRLSTPSVMVGETTYLVGRPSRESNRKKQLRQQSAQRLMESIKGVEQPLRCRNVAFLLLFVFHLLFVGVYLGEKFAKDSVGFLAHHVPSKVKEIYYDKLLVVAILSGAFAIVTSTLLLCAMAVFARHFLQIALIMIITLSFIWGTIGIGLSPSTVVPVTGIIALGLAVGYTFIVWDRLPFASANLISALSGIRAYPSTVIVAIVMQVVTWAWCIYFSIVVAGIYNAIQHQKIQMNQSSMITCYVMLGFSFYWTYQVVHGCVKAITAGVISGWWHTPDYPRLVGESCFKTLFYSIGSICFGGLLIGPVTIIRQLSIFIRPSHTEPSLMCFHECIHVIQTYTSSAVDFMTVRCNAYSFTYVGMYHYGFLDAGVNASELFAKRGWTTIVSDDLVPNVLFLTSLVMGGVTGCFAHIVATIYDVSITSLDVHTGYAFVIGAVIGLVLNSIVFSVVNSSMNTVLVCFASSPVDFERNHPELSDEMRTAWREVWPGALDFVIHHDHHHGIDEDGIPML